jgi:hypothetical protein
MFAKVGTVNASQDFVAKDAKGNIVIKENIDACKDCWQKPLAF